MAVMGSLTDEPAGAAADLLYETWQQFGDVVWRRASLTRNLLSDVIPDDRRALHCLFISVNSGAARQLLYDMRLNDGASTVHIRRLESALYEDYGLAWPYARWVIQVWEFLFCRIYSYRNSRPNLTVATKQEVDRLKDMLPYYLKLERYDDYYETAEALSRLNQPQGYFARGLCYLHGYHIEANDIEAYKSFLLAAEQGHSQSQYAAAICCELGRGCTTSYARAISWYERAAEQGHEAAAASLAELLSTEDWQS